MSDPLPQTMGCRNMQEFVEDAITDPGALAALTKTLRRPVKRAWWFRWLILASALLGALILGLLLGHFVI